MKFKTFIESNLSHTEEDDKYYDKLLQDFTKRPTELIGTIKNIQIHQRAWPYGKINYFLANGEPVGLAIIQQGGRTRDVNADWYSVTMLYLQKAYRRQGIGTEFFKFLTSQGYKLKPDDLKSNGGEALQKKVFNQS
jgi:GNAT superfamily N-acetyltransferase